MNIQKKEFKKIILKNNLNEIISRYIFEPIPYIFNADLNLFVHWKETLATEIKVDPKCILIVGGASIGFSLNPYKDFKDFDQNSDIDVAIISSFHFEVAWHYMQMLGTDLFSWESKAQESLKDHRERLIYWGTIATDEIIQYLPFGKEWILSVDKMKKISPTDKRDINFRIYKNFESLRLYQKNSLKTLRHQIKEAN